MPPDAPRIYGPDGRPVSTVKRDLVRRLAAPVRTGFRRAQQWQSIVTTLDPARLRAIYWAIANGSWCPDFFELAEEIEERDLHYRGVLQQRRLRGAGAPIDVVPASDAAADRRLADEVRERVMQGSGWHSMLLDLLDALGKGVSCLEIVWRQAGGRWEPAEYHRIDPRWLVWDDTDGRTPLLIREWGDKPSSGRMAGAMGVSRPGAFRTRADPLMPGKFVYHAHQAKSGLPTRGGLAFSVATMYLLKSVAVRDWWAFGELYGIPVRIGKYGQTATDDDIRTLSDAVSALASDAGAIIPDSMNIELENAASSSGGGGSGSLGLFRGQAEWCDKQVSKAVVGQTMTTDDGSSRSQAEVHADVRDDLVRDDMRQVCGTLSQTVVRWYCELNHGMRPAGWPRIELPQPPEDLDVVAIMSAVKGGLRVPAAWLRERLGIPDPQEGEEVLTGAPIGMPAGDGSGGDDNGSGGDDDAGEMNAARPALNAALEAVADAADWGEISASVAAPLRRALRGAGTTEEFLSAAAAAGAPEALAADLARQAFPARVDGEVG